GEVDSFLEECVITCAEVRQRCVAEDGHEQQDESEWNDEHAEDEFTQRASPRNTREEQTYEWRPRHPPRPEEQSPVTQPLIGWVAGRSLCISEIIEQHAGEATEEITDILNQLAKQLSGLAGNQDPQQQTEREQHVELGEPANTFINTGDGGEDCDSYRQND